MFKLRCIVDVDLFKNGNFIKDQFYIARTAKNDSEIYIKGDKQDQWNCIKDQKMHSYKPSMDVYFEVVEVFYC